MPVKIIVRRSILYSFRKIHILIDGKPLYSLKGGETAEVEIAQGSKIQAQLDWVKTSAIEYSKEYNQLEITSFASNYLVVAAWLLLLTLCVLVNLHLISILYFSPILLFCLGILVVMSTIFGSSYLKIKLTK